ncbi:unnamed protein product [Dicrocoelium dendriticum]|nr:unnamed protein product [Dicrocoelium dendriticum]
MQFVLDNNQPGKLQGEIVHNGPNRISTSYIEHYFPVSCQLRYSMLHRSLVWNFTKSMPFSMLLDGPVEVECFNKELNLTRTVRKLVRTSRSITPRCVLPRAINVDTYPNQYISCRQTLMAQTRLSPVSATSSSRCTDTSQTYIYEDGILNIKQKPKAPKVQIMFCSGGIDNQTVLFHDSTLKLAPNPVQPFYVFDQPRPIRFYFTSSTASREQRRILHSLEMSCDLLLPNNGSSEEVRQVTSSIGNTLSLQNLTLEPLSGYYLVRCAASDYPVRSTYKMLILSLGVYIQKG